MKRLWTLILCAAVITTFGFASSTTVRIHAQIAQEKPEAKTYDAYVGQYEVNPGFVLSITNENGKLMGQPTGDPKVEFKAEATADEFFSRDANARLKFVRDESSVVTGVVVTLDGKDYPSKKIK